MHLLMNLFIHSFIYLFEFCYLHFYSPTLTTLDNRRLPVVSPYFPAISTLIFPFNIHFYLFLLVYQSLLLVSVHLPVISNCLAVVYAF